MGVCKRDSSRQATLDATGRKDATLVQVSGGLTSGMRTRRDTMDVPFGGKADMGQTFSNVCF